MKNLILSILVILFTSTSFGQNFPRNDIQLLLNKELKVTETSKSSFYKDSKLNNRLWDDIILTGKTFHLISYEKKSSWDEDEYILKIMNKEIGILYYKYFSTRQDLFDFEVIGGLDLPDDFYCKYIEEEKDKFTGETKYESVETQGVSFIKIKKGKSSKIYIIIKFIGQLTTATGNGPIIILLENDKRLVFHNNPIGVIVKYLEAFGTYIPGHIWLSSITLSDKDIKLLKENKITDIRLSVSDKSIKFGETIIEYLKCILTK